MFLAKRKDGQRGVAIVPQMDLLNDEWEMERPLTLSKAVTDVEIKGEKVKIHSTPRIQFNIRYKDFVPFVTEKEEDD